MKVVLKIAVLLILYGCLSSITVKSRNIGRRMHFITSNTSYGTEYLSSLNSSIVDDRLNLDMTLIKVLDYPLKAWIRIQFKLRDSLKYQTVLSYDVEICQLLNQVRGQTILRKWIKNMLKYGNMMEYCPVEKDHYYVRNLTLETQSIPVFLQPGDYRIFAYVYYGKRDQRNDRLVLSLETKIVFL